MRATVVICPGNGCINIRQSNWYGQLYNELKERGIPCVCEDFPDPHQARRTVWIPFIESLVKRHADGDGKNIILIGHSSGAQAALRYTETHEVKASILVSATYSDLGDESERLSGYYPQPSSDGEETNAYDFDSMKVNCPIWHQFHSNDDPFIPLFEAERIRDGLCLQETYRVLPGRSHFFSYDPAFLDVITALC